MWLRFRVRLELMAQRAGTSQSAVFEQAIREKARREKISLDADATNGAHTQPAALTGEQQAAAERGMNSQLIENNRNIIVCGAKFDLSGARLPGKAA